MANTCQQLSNYRLPLRLHSHFLCCLCLGLPYMCLIYVFTLLWACVCSWAQKTSTLIMVKVNRTSEKCQLLFLKKSEPPLAIISKNNSPIPVESCPVMCPGALLACTFPPLSLALSSSPGLSLHYPSLCLLVSSLFLLPGQVCLWPLISCSFWSGSSWFPNLQLIPPFLTFPVPWVSV